MYRALTELSLLHIFIAYSGRQNYYSHTTVNARSFPDIIYLYIIHNILCMYVDFSS